MDSHKYCTQNNVYLLIINFKDRYLFPTFILYFFLETNKVPLLHTTVYLNNTSTVSKHPRVYVQSVQSCLAMKVFQNAYHAFMASFFSLHYIYVKISYNSKVCHENDQKL